VVGAALDGGVNILDVFMPQAEVRTRIGNAIREVRQNIYLQGHIGAVLENGQYKRTRDVAACDEFVRDFLARYHTDTIDIGMIHFVDDLDDWHAIRERKACSNTPCNSSRRVSSAPIGLSSH